MITLSNFVVLGIIEVYALFFGGLIVLIYYNRSLGQRINKLRTTIQTLKQHLSQKKTKPTEAKPDFLESAIAETEKRFRSIAPDKEISLNEELELTALLAALRHEFLNTENNATKIQDNEKKWEALDNSLSTLISQLQSTSSDTSHSDASADNLKSSWQDLCKAAINMLDQRSSETEDNLVALLQVINSELGFDQLEVPERKSLSEQRSAAYNHNVEAVNELKESSGENKMLIATLLSQKDAAESEVSIKTEALVKLQRFLNESEVCIKLLEDELEDLRADLKAEKNIPNDTKELQSLVQSFAKESSEMLTCIDTLERENTELRNKLG
ncbi:MAG: hypothetical protein JKY88_09235 [Pseudomonadales bacterium]|nr:hypothetical protein [Pseudomonadales bacterium]